MNKEFIRACAENREFRDEHFHPHNFSAFLRFSEFYAVEYPEFFDYTMKVMYASGVLARIIYVIYETYVVFRLLDPKGSLLAFAFIDVAGSKRDRVTNPRDTSVEAIFASRGFRRDSDGNWKSVHGIECVGS